MKLLVIVVLSASALNFAEAKSCTAALKDFVYNLESRKCEVRTLSGDKYPENSLATCRDCQKANTDASKSKCLQALPNSKEIVCIAIVNYQYNPFSGKCEQRQKPCTIPEVGFDEKAECETTCKDVPTCDKL